MGHREEGRGPVCTAVARVQLCDHVIAVDSNIPDRESIVRIREFAPRRELLTAALARFLSPRFVIQHTVPAMSTRGGGRQSMSELKLRRLLEHNQRLKEDLARPRLKVSEASAR